MSVLHFYNETRKNFPDITLKADIDCLLFWDEIDPEFAFSWFEHLANALNKEMSENVKPGNHQKLIEYISVQYRTGDEEVKGCIDVSFVENLFWRVPAKQAKPYWSLLPDNLKELYVYFHGKTPL